MSKLKVWIIGGTTIPVVVDSDRCGGISGSVVQQDCWLELSGSETQLKADYLAIKGKNYQGSFTNNGSEIGSGSMFAKLWGDPDGNLS